MKDLVKNPALSVKEIQSLLQIRFSNFQRNNSLIELLVPLLKYLWYLI